MICAPRFAASLIPEIAFLRFASGFWSQLICTNPTVTEPFASIFFAMQRSISKGMGEGGEGAKGRRAKGVTRRCGDTVPRRLAASPRRPSACHPLGASVFGRFLLPQNKIYSYGESLPHK